MTKTMSPEEWADRENIPRSTVYYLLTKSKKRKLPFVVEEIRRFRIPSNVTKNDIVNI